jgi:uncharacterized membrane protein YphA (DoxX/SURF4 family)
MQKLEGYDDLALLIGRLFYSSLFCLYGYFKLTGYAGTVGYMTKQGLPVPALFAVLAIIFELGGGILMLIGYQTRLVALALAVYVVVAALIAHTHRPQTSSTPHSEVVLSSTMIRGVVSESLSTLSFRDSAQSGSSQTAAFCITRMLSASM